MTKIFLLLILFSLTLGFRVWQGGIKWDVSVNDPFLYVKLCDPDKIMTNNLPDSDILAQFPLNKNIILQSILDDINNLDTSYLQMMVYPDGLDTTHVITICSGSSGALGAVGEAKVETDSSKITKCTISIDPNKDNDAKAWMRTAAHEIGHCLGLMHPQDSIHSIMSYFSDRDFLRYQIDDLMGISFLYPSPSYDLKEKPTFGLKCSTK